MFGSTNTVIYVRSSTHGPHSSLAHQRTECRTFATENGLRILRDIPGLPEEVFSDGVFSDTEPGSTPKRGCGYGALLEAVENPGLRVRFVVVADISRLGRTGLDVLKRRIEHVGVELLCVG